MAIEVITEFIAKTTVRVRAYVKDDKGVLVDASTSIKVIISDPSGTVQIPSEGNGDDDMTKDGDNTGVYDYYYKTTTSSEKGWWSGQVVVVDGSGALAKTSVGTFNFRIK